MIEIIADSNRGQYIPQHFSEACDMEQWNVDPKDAAILSDGPDNEWYWETWHSVVQYAKHTDKDGIEWRLWQDGDLFAITADDDTFAEDY